MSEKMNYYKEIEVKIESLGFNIISKDFQRPWELGVLHTIDRRLSSDLLVELRTDKALCIGDNLPYSGDLPGDTLDQHCIPSNHLHALIELRNDLLASETLINYWANYLASKILKVVKNSTTKRI